MTDKLPNAERAQVETRKVTDYLLSTDHPDGKSKAKYFIEHGFVINQPDSLARSLIKHGQTQPVIKESVSEFGKKFILECQCETPNGRNPCIRSVWIVEIGTLEPRLVTAFPT